VGLAVDGAVVVDSEVLRAIIADLCDCVGRSSLQVVYQLIDNIEEDNLVARVV
jgi:hypothetical protein